MKHPFRTAQWSVRVHGWWTRAVIVFAGATVLALTSEPADAGTYTVSGCRSGWAPDVRNTTGTAGIGTPDYCDTSGVLRANLGGAFSTNNPGDYAGWRFAAPSDTTISRAAVRWHGWTYFSGNWRMAYLESSVQTPPIYHFDRFDEADDDRAV
jgi:hypothetical protein